MNIIQVGSSGHYEYALAAAKRAGFRFTGICMGDRAKALNIDFTTVLWYNKHNI